MVGHSVCNRLLQGDENSFEAWRGVDHVLTYQELLTYFNLLFSFAKITLINMQKNLCFHSLLQICGSCQICVSLVTFALRGTKGLGFRNEA